MKPYERPYVLERPFSEKHLLSKQLKTVKTVYTAGLSGLFTPIIAPYLRIK